MPRIAAFALLLLLSVAFLPCPGVGADEPFVTVQRRDSSRSNATSRTVFSGNPRLVWRTQSAQPITSEMFEHKSRLYYGHGTKVDDIHTDGYLAELDTDTGKLISDRQVFGSIVYSPFLAYDRLFFVASRAYDTFVSHDQGREYATLYEFLPDDTEFIRGSTLFNCSAAPLPSLGVIAVSEGPALRALDVLTFEDSWRVDAPEDFRGSWFSVMPLLVPSRSLLVGGSGASGLVAVSASNGELRWSRSLSPGIIPEVCHADDNLFAVTTEGDILCLNAADGSPVYLAKARGPLSTSLSVSDGVLYAGIEGGEIAAFGAKDGSTLWQKGGWGNLTCAPFVAGDKLLFGTFDGNMCCLNAADGSLVWRYRAYSSIMFTPVLDAHGRVYFSDDRRVIYCLGPEEVKAAPAADQR